MSQIYNQIGKQRTRRLNQMRGLSPLSRWPRTSEKQNFPLLDTLAFVACCATGYMVLVML